MKRRLVLFMGVFLLLIGSVIASDVAYIYRNEKAIQQGFLDGFFNAGLSVDFVEDKNIKDTDFSNYYAILVGDERFRNARHLPLDKPVIVANKYYAKMFGFLERGGTRKLASNSKLKIKKDNEIVEVYDRARYSLGKSGVPYYYLPTRYENPDIEQVGLTFTKREVELGSVVAHKSDDYNKCFFGITKTNFWTKDASNLFDECIDFVFSGVHDVSIDTSLSNSVNGVRIKDVEAGEYMLDLIPELKCDKQYKVDYKTWNVGDFVEDIDFTGVFGSFSWTATKTGLAVGKSTSTGSKTITIDDDFEEGFYDIQITASIDLDNNLVDNTISRRVEVVC